MLKHSAALTASPLASIKALLVHELCESSSRKNAQVLSNCPNYKAISTKEACVFVFPSSNFPKGRENISVYPCFYKVKRALVNFGRAWKVTDVSETLCQAKYICKQINPSPGLVGRNH